MKAALAFVLAVLAAPTLAQSVGDCGAWASARYLAEPWELHSVTVADGQVRLAVLDTFEPAHTAVHLMVLSPAPNGAHERQCKVVSMKPPAVEGGVPTGFLSLDFAARKDRYNQRRGLDISMRGGVYDALRGATDMGVLTVTIDATTGEVSAGIAAK